MEQQFQLSTPRFPKITYRRSGAGPALMLLHGFPSSGSLWDSVGPALAGQCTLLVPDLPGTGDSTMASPDVSIEALAELVPAILDNAGIERCVLAGHSMGGYIALAALDQYPERLNGLALIHSTAAADDDAKKEKREKSIALIEKGGREQFVRGMIPGLFAPEFAAANPGVVSHWTEEGLKLPEESLITFYRAMIGRPERMATLRDTKIPVLFVLGEEDSTIPWQTVVHQTGLPAVSFVEKYPGAGHMGMIEKSGRLVADLNRFVSYCR